MPVPTFFSACPWTHHIHATQPLLLIRLDLQKKKTNIYQIIKYLMKTGNSIRKCVWKWRFLLRECVCRSFWWHTFDRVWRLCWTELTTCRSHGISWRETIAFFVWRNIPGDYILVWRNLFLDFGMRFILIERVYEIFRFICLLKKLEKISCRYIWKRL